MEIRRLENLPPPPSIINAIRAGFDAVASRIRVIFFPLLLNLFLWLGPRLRIDAFFDASIKTEMIASWQQLNVSAADIQNQLALADQVMKGFNLFWMLRTLPIGISSLPLSRQASATPLGEPTVWQANLWIIFLSFFILTFIGWVGGAVYFRSVAWAAVPNVIYKKNIFWTIFHSILVSIFCNILFLIIGIPLMLFLQFVFSKSAGVASAVILLASFFFMWLIVPIFFLPHGVFVYKQNALSALISSINITRMSLPGSSLFVLTVFLMAYGLNILWGLPPESSWLTLFSIFGHSFVTTALLAASFIYYRDISEWTVALIEKIKSPVKQA